jgi:TolB-like protein/Flp pilus assembly protein TadD
VTTEDDRAPLSSEVKRLEGEVGTHAHYPLLHLPLFEQLKQRNVFRVAVLYLVVCWLVLDPVHVVFHMLDVPIWANRLVVMLMAVGFPAVVIFAWVYEITPEGLKPTVEVPHHESIRKITGRRLDRAIIAVLAVALTYFVVDKFWISPHVAPPQAVSSASPETVARATTAPATASTFAPPPHSIAVLPFVNLSGDPNQQYFSDGLTEELLNSLSRINELQVAARTSSFSFQGEHPDIATVAHKLNVGAVLEGSVRRSAHTVRINAQLVNGVTGFHLWSQTYDRNLGDVLKLQTEIASAVANALEVTLLGDVSAKIELGGTRNPAAFDGYLRGAKAYSTLHDANDRQSAAAVYPVAAAAYTEAIRLDPNYALAFVGRSMTLSQYAGDWLTGQALLANYDKALADARRAIALAPELGEAHLALARALWWGFFDFTHAGDEYARARALAPGNSQVLQDYGAFAASTGRTEAGLAAIRHAVRLDPLSTDSLYRLGEAQWISRRYNEAAAAFEEVITLDPDASRAYAWRGLAYYGLGDFQSARSSCEARGQKVWPRFCLELVYYKLGRHADAEATFTKVRAEVGDAAAYQYAEMYTQWGNTPRALEWLQTAVRLHDKGVRLLKRDPLMDPLRKEPRFQAVMRELKFPD